MRTDFKMRIDFGAIRAAHVCALPHTSHLVPRTSNLALLAVGFLHLVPRTYNLTLLAVGFSLYHLPHIT